MLLSDKYTFLTEYFEQVLSLDTKPFPHAILFYGNDISSQYAISKELARVLNCKENRADDCECLNCRWVRNNTHPAVMTISRADNKPADDKATTVISVKQADFIKENLLKTSDAHRVFIFCDRDESGNVAGLNKKNFQDPTANALLKAIEEPQPRVTFIFLTRFIDDVLPTIASRCECFYVPNLEKVNFDYSIISGIFDNYWEFDRKDVFIISQKLADLTKTYDITDILSGIQNYILCLLKSNPRHTILIEHAKVVEEAMKQAKLGIKPASIFDDLCLRIIK